MKTPQHISSIINEINIFSKEPKKRLGTKNKSFTFKSVGVAN